MKDILSKINKDSGEPVKLTPESKFSFNCHKGVSCFNECCGNLDVFLTPADILKMKNRLEMTSLEFLSVYTETVMLEKTKIPFIKLTLNEDGKCRFVTEEGCAIYSDRPLACRYFPLGFGIIRGSREEVGDFFFLVKEDYCNGFEEKKEWTVREWRADQGIDELDDINKDWVDIILKKKTKGSEVDPDERSLNLFLMGSYDIDSFKKFVFDSRFLDVFDLDEAYIDLMRNDELELLKFAHQWLQYVFFKEPTVALKEKSKE